jgi:hypothetical protein
VKIVKSYNVTLQLVDVDRVVVRDPVNVLSGKFRQENYGLYRLSDFTSTLVGYVGADDTLAELLKAASSLTYEFGGMGVAWVGRLAVFTRDYRLDFAPSASSRTP